VSGLTKSQSISWQLALDSTFQKIVSHGSETTNQYQDYTVKAVVAGLEPGRNYFYRFNCRGVTSPIGRTRTLPEGDIDRLGLALASCSNYAFGFFNGYDAIARDDAVDFVLHLGDYIYEYAATGWGAQSPMARTGHSGKTRQRGNASFR
jgi:alkaline phosphatase D